MESEAPADEQVLDERVQPAAATGVREIKHPAGLSDSQHVQGARDAVRFLQAAELGSQYLTEVIEGTRQSPIISIPTGMQLDGEQLILDIDVGEAAQKVTGNLDAQLAFRNAVFGPVVAYLQWLKNDSVSRLAMHANGLYQQAAQSK